MKTMIWKELREIARWAALAFFCLLLAEGFTLSSQRQAMANYLENITLCDSTFLLVSAFGCSTVGAFLGALQILPERRRDQWAALLHRPVPRRVILLGKVAAGLLLYVLATGLPLLVSVIYVARPGHFAAPFVPNLALPAASDLLLGVVFYFASILLGLHAGRWFGSRGAIALGAVGILVLHLAESGYPFALPLAGALVLFVAALGAMRGSIALRPWISRVAVGLVMLIGIQAGLIFVGQALRGFLPPRYPSYFYTDFMIANDGTVFRQQEDGKGTLTDMQGNMVTDERYVGNQSERTFIFPYPLAYRESARARRFRTNSRSSQDSVELVTLNHEGPELWYRLVGDGSYFIGYDKLSARCIGICDADGFKSPGAVAHPFASEPQGDPIQSFPFVYWVGSQIFTLDFAERRMVPLFNVGRDTIYGALKFPYYSEHSRIAIALESTIRLVDTAGVPLFTVPYGYAPDLWPNISITATEDHSRTFLVYAPGTHPFPKNQEPVVHLDVVDVRGQGLASYTIPASRLDPVGSIWNVRIASLLNMPLPAVLAAATIHRHEGDFSANDSIPSLLVGIDHPEFRNLWLLSAFLGAVAGVWARRAGLSVGRTITWVALTIVFGAAGFLAYRLATDWPARVRCPRCALRRPVSAVACPHCHEAWEGLPASGAEIFEAA